MGDISSRHSVAVLVSIGAFALTPFPATAASAAGARIFLQKIYSHYPTPPDRKGFIPTGPVARQVFDPGMVALLREDERLADGEVGAIDADPLCDCQDDSGLKITIEDVRLAGPASAKARVTLQFGAPAAPATERLQISLAVVAGQWRIHDIGSRATPSLRAYLLHENHANANGRR